MDHVNQCVGVSVSDERAARSRSHAQTHTHTQRPADEQIKNNKNHRFAIFFNSFKAAQRVRYMGTEMEQQRWTLTHRIHAYTRKFNN